MREPDRALELDPFAFDLEKHAAFLIVHRSAEIGFERGHLSQDVIDSSVHCLYLPV